MDVISSILLPHSLYTSKSVGCGECAFYTVCLAGDNIYKFMDLCISLIGDGVFLRDFESEEEKARVFSMVRATIEMEIVHG